MRQPSGCLEWTGALSSAGYGQIWVNGRQVGAHRLAWTLSVGPLTKADIVRHYVCDNPPCCEPTHLRVGTQADNIADMDAKGRRVLNMGKHNTIKTHCPRGHPYAGANLYIPDEGRRACRICRYASVVRWRAKVKRALLR